MCGNAGDFTTTIIWPPLLDLGFENPSNHAFEAQEYSGVDSQEPELVYQNNTGQVFSQDSPLSEPLLLPSHPVISWSKN